MDKKLFQYPEDDFFILLYNESLLEFNIQKANAFLIESCNCFLKERIMGLGRWHFQTREMSYLR